MCIVQLSLMEDLGFAGRHGSKERIINLKTENSCINCAVLECSVRFDCEDNVLSAETPKLFEERETADVYLQVVMPELAEKAVDKKRP